MTAVAPRCPATNGELNRLSPSDRPVHDWYRFVLSFPPHLVRTYLEKFGITPGHRVLDPFCGTGTVVVECKKQGISSVAVEANPLARFAGQVKVNWGVDPERLLDHATRVADAATRNLAAEGRADEPLASNRMAAEPLRTLPPERARLLLDHSISPLPLHKALTLLNCLAELQDPACSDHERLALAKSLVQSSSNLRFGPEVGVRPAKPDAAVIAPWLDGVRAIAADLRVYGSEFTAPATVKQGDARALDGVLERGSIDAVITSPPYPNEKDYTRATRLESVLLGFISDKEQLRELKRGLVRSNTRGVYRTDDDDQFVTEHREVQRIAAAIEARRIELGKTSGFERMYARATLLYFGGMARHLAELRPALRPGAQLAYVVGDQASYLRVMIRTGAILAQIAGTLGYEVMGIDLFRTRRATATGEELREEAVLLRWPGPVSSRPRTGEQIPAAATAAKHPPTNAIAAPAALFFA